MTASIRQPASMAGIANSHVLIHAAVFNDRRLSLAAKGIYGCLTALLSGTQTYATEHVVASLIQANGGTATEVHNALQELAQHGYLQNYGPNGNVQRLVEDPGAETDL